jgi:Sigma-70 region 2
MGKFRRRPGRAPTGAGPEEAADPELLRRMRQEDESALEALYRRYGGLVYTLALRIVGDPELAREVLQDTFLRAWNGREMYDPVRGRVPWWVASAVRVLETTMTSTLARTNSWATAKAASFRRSAYRRSMTMFSPSTHPCSRKPATNACHHESVSGVLGALEMYPICRIVPPCCASAASGVSARLTARMIQSPIGRMGNLG